MINITNHPDIIDKINTAINNGKIVEVKNERKKDKPENVTVVEIKRTLIK